MLCHNPKLAKTSQKPGKTLLINHFLINNEWYLVDLPGYGFAQTGQKQREQLKRMIERYCLLREQLCNLFVLVDCRLKPQKNDVEFMNWLGENNIPFSIVFTKADKISKSQLAQHLDTYRTTLQQTWEELPPIFVTSAESGLGREDVIDYIEQINATL